jgi:hypothetical protein
MNLSDAVSALAIKVDDAWAKHGRAEEVFPEIAASRLAQGLDFGFEEVAGYLCAGGELPEQRRVDQAFGQPCLTLVSGPLFSIELLCWMEGTPAIHQHGFSGAFTLLQGRSVHSRYSFEQTGMLGQLRIGKLCLSHVELLDTSSVVPIPRGDGLIHSAFHLDSPSVTLVIRTHQMGIAELSYLPPGVGYDTSARDMRLHKVMQLLDLLNRIDHPSYFDYLHEVISTANPYGALAITLRAATHAMTADRFTDLSEVLIRRFGDHGVHLASAAKEEYRRIALIRRRADTRMPDQRMFLACLLSFTERESILRTLADFHGETHPFPASIESITNGVAMLIGGDATRREVAKFCALAALDNVGVDQFPAWLESAWTCKLPELEQAKLVDFYSAIRSNPLVEPLIKVASKRLA